MLSKLLLGAVVALASPQERTDERVHEVRVPIEIEIPAISIPQFDIEIPAIEFSVSDVGYHFEGFELDLVYDMMEIPSFTIQIPDVEYMYWYHDHDDWDYQDQEMDTTLDVSRGDRLELRNHAGEIVIRSWNRDQVRVEASYSSDDRIKVFQSGSAVNVKTEARHGHPESVDFNVTIPSWMAVDLWGFYTDISVQGAENGVHVETLEGDVEIRACGGEISLKSVEGDVVVQGGTGDLEANNMDGSISVFDFEGQLYAESIDGDITLEGITSSGVEAKTVDGSVYYEGTVADDGRYKLTSHDGDIVVRIPTNVNARISVATFDGEFESEFPIQLQGTQASRKFNFTLGEGGARIDLSTFDGNIQLLRR
jgi:DUF4097 and DUF4098 domain-containing protein YvlB